MVAAVAGMAVFAALAMVLVQSSRSAIVTAVAEVGQARAAAAADAGVALALNGLLIGDRANRWSIDGRTRVLRFEDTTLRIRIEDERGKVPLGLLDEDTAPRLIAAAGVGNSEAERIATDSLLDWTDDDDDPRNDGAESAWYERRSIRPRNGPLQSIDELVAVRGFNAAAVDRVRSFVTVNFGTGGFDARFAQPRAIGIMLAGGEDSPLAIARERELAGQRVAIEIGDDLDLTGRPLMIVVEAARADGSRAARRVVIELTGSRVRPYVVRSFD